MNDFGAAALESQNRKPDPDLVPILESLLTYSSVQLSLNNSSEAKKSASAVIRLCAKDNPRLLAMGHLVMAEAFIKSRDFVEASQHLGSARKLESQIDHTYVADRRAAVEKQMLGILVLKDVLGDLSGKELRTELNKAEDLLLGWFIEHHSSKTSMNKVAEDLGLDRRRIEAYLQRLDKHSPYYHLKKIKKERRHKQSQH